MSFRVFCVALGTLTFSLAFAITSWKQGLWRHGEKRPPLAVASRAAVAAQPWHKFPAFPARPEPSRLAVHRTPSVPHSYTATMAAADTPVTPPDEGSRGADPQGLSALAVPVTYVVYRVLGQPNTRTPTLMNVSSNTLELSITATDTPTGAQTVGDVTIGPWGRAKLSDLGLSLQPGDQITLHSPPYRDQSFTYQ